MSDLFEDEPDDNTGANAPEFTVTEISGAVKRSVESGFSHVRVRGEIGRISRPRSGHIYLDLKDDRSVLAGVVWKGQAARLPMSPEEGMEVIATGRLTTFPGQSKYQMVIESMAPAGVGALMAMLEKRRKALDAEGLFAPDRKRPLPYLPEIIGVVTSPSGAVIRDILHRLRDRFPRKVLIWPVAVQGKACAPEVTRAIEGFNAMTPGGALPRPDVLIIARGGGSVEDLWGFNEESVVRAAAASGIPLISAVGHETDTTLIDHAADRRAPTPTAAAEMAVPVRLDLLNWVDTQGGRLSRAATQSVSQRQQRLRDVSRALPRPETLADAARQRLDLAGDRLPRALTDLTRDRRMILSEASTGLHPGRLRDRLQSARDRLSGLGGRLDLGLRHVVARQQDRLNSTAQRLPGAAQKEARRHRQDLEKLAVRLTIRPVLQNMTRQQDRLRGTASRLPVVARSVLRDQRQRLSALDRVHQSFDHSRVLDRGFVLVRDTAGVLITHKAQAEKAGALELEFSDGKLPLGAGPSGPKARPSRKGKSTKPAQQASLFGDDPAD